MKSKLFKSLLFAVVGSAALLACRSSKIGQGAYCNIEKGDVRFGLRVTSGFEELKAQYSGYAKNYERLVDSLKFSSADTIALFIRPCFLHRGISFEVRNGVMSSYYFDFSKQKREVIALANNCAMAQNYFAFLTQDNKTKTDVTVLTVPDCPVDLFLKMGTSFFYGNIPGPEAGQYSGLSIEFETLIRQSDSLTRIYSESR